MNNPAKIRKIRVADGIFWVEAPDADLYIQCGCPADSVKHMMKRGLIIPVETSGVAYETGPNALLLSDVMLQGGDFANLGEFPVLQMLYRQGMILPGHPKNTGIKPMIIGLREQVNSQLQYIYRGNYGLISEEEIIETGVDPERAREMMRLKLKFAFGKILNPRDLLDTRIVGAEDVEIRNGVFIRRLGLNVFEFEYEGEKVAVDLNLDASESYDSPYPLGFHRVQKDYFSVIHSGQGDGWDINRPSMSSLLMFQGKVYLIDAGPNIMFSLVALGIGINEIEGIFHTHSHDDHFAGLTSLMRTDRRIKYYAAPMVRASVAKKLAALMSIEEDSLEHYFDIHDINPDAWNPVDGLEVLPIYSPHPVETTILIFRAQGGEGSKTYAHFADIVSLGVLEGMITESEEEPGLSRDLFDKIKMDYLMAADLKKIDIGGGLIHGDAEDFREDRSKKIVLSHTSLKLTAKQKEVGSGAPFGTVDVLIESHQDHSFREAYGFLRAYFPDIPDHQIKVLLNSPVVTFNPETILVKKGEVNKSIYLLLTGNVEVIRADISAYSVLSAGALVGELPGLLGMPMPDTFRAASFVKALKIKCSLYLEFVQRNNLFDEIQMLQQNREFMQKTGLFGESISYPTQNMIAKAMKVEHFAKGGEVGKDRASLYVIKSGVVERTIGHDVLETMTKGDFFGEELSVFDTPGIYSLRVAEPSDIFIIPSKIIKDLPVVRWRLFEAFERRIRMVTDADGARESKFLWRDEYAINVQEMDKHHRKMFEMADHLSQSVKDGSNRSVIEDALKFLIGYTKLHFESEESLMARYGYPATESHTVKHERLIKKVDEMKGHLWDSNNGVNNEFIEFLKDWIISHILTEDVKYAVFLNNKGVY
ncbi:MAG: cyclic nucleotide-binding protein [Rhodospirillales bacterium RIFCSPLOWO2_12_FULL_58_28]|nr:MAG: cyclic nucleotide-binding protein [Rhodospirillales bacterium RIFCSPLOWO2_02_FULL_58_16]OHC78878.1 MAG: cyclic nucleotide-binding protein [Rhodospirillales bacterium RIFCSPLOWO2_12_FULL_58_28]